MATLLLSSRLQSREAGRPTKLTAEGGTGTTGIRWRPHHLYTDAGQAMRHCERCGCAKSVCTADKRVWLPAHIFWLSVGVSETPSVRRTASVRPSLRPKISSLETTGSCSRLFKRLSYNAHQARVHPSLWRPNLRVNWNRKLEQMLFWQNPFRKPFFQFLTDFGKLPVFLFQCRPTSKPPSTSGSPVHVRPHTVSAQVRR